MSLIVDVSVEEPRWSAVDDLPGLAESVIATASAEAGAVLAPHCEVSCLFCDDRTIRALNAQWRGKDQPTNVLSFPAGGPDGPGAGALLGDIVLAFETVEREASAEGKPLAAHVTHLLVHGFLHLIGHDHEDAAEAEAMEALESRTMIRLGCADPYAERPAMDAS